MKREYANSNDSYTADFFYGIEVEKTPMYGKDTLFVVGIKTPDEVQLRLTNEPHIFFGANHSFNPANQQEAEQWNNLIAHFVDLGYYCSLDIPITQLDKLDFMPVLEDNLVIPQIRVPIPHVTKMNYHTTIKIDDVGFAQTNPGVWVHNLHDLLARDKFTSWNDYSGDAIVK